MIKIYASLLLATALASCGTKINYIGNSYTATETIDVFVDESAIPKNYTIVGKGYVRSYRNKPENIQNKAIAKARQKGADGILIKDAYIPVNTIGINTSFRTDSSGKGVLTLGNAVPSPASSEFIIWFLKYK